MSDKNVYIVSGHLQILIALFSSRVHVLHKIRAMKQGSNIFGVFIVCFIFQLMRLLPWKCPSSFVDISSSVFCLKIRICLLGCFSSRVIEKSSVAEEGKRAL